MKHLEEVTDALSPDLSVPLPAAHLAIPGPGNSFTPEGAQMRLCAKLQH